MATLEKRQKKIWDEEMTAGERRPRLGKAMTEEDRAGLMQLHVSKVREGDRGLTVAEDPEGNEKLLRFFKASIEVDKALFSNEIDKWEMLNILWAGTALFRYRVTGFTLMDDTLELVLCKEYESDSEMNGEEPDLQDTLLEFLSRTYMSYYKEKRAGLAGGVRERSTWEELGSTQMVVDECCRIHQMPVQKGYVKNIGDFHWSSYPTYHGNYSWAFVNLAPVLGCLSPDMNRAQHAFMKRQKKWEKGKPEGGKPEKERPEKGDEQNNPDE